MNSQQNLMAMTPPKKTLPAFIRSPKSIAKITLCLVCLALVYLPAFAKLFHDLIDMPEFSHGFLFPPISVYLIWQRSKQLGNKMISPRNAGLPIIILGLLLFLIGNIGAVFFITIFSFLVVLSGITLYLLGKSYLKAYLFPFGILIFAIPLPSILVQKITFPMQLFASKVAACSLQLFDIPVLREGNIIHLTGGILEVAEACSGIRSLISLISVSTLLAYFLTKVTWHRIIMILFCFPVAIIVNAFRVSMTGVLAHYYGMKVAYGFFHSFSGAVIYFCGLIIIAAIGAFLLKWEKVKSNSGKVASISAVLNITDTSIF